MAAVRRYDILDTPLDGAFDRIAAIAAKLLSVPIGIISIVDTDRVWFKAHHGLDIDQVGRDPGLCASAVLHDAPWILTDALKDIRSLANPLVAGEFGLRFYAGVPLKTADGHNLGTLCVIDREPRDISDLEISMLEDLAATVMDQLELRLSAIRTASALARSDRERDQAIIDADTLDKESRLLAAIVESSHDAIVSKDLNGIVTSWNHGAEMILGYPAHEIIGKPITLIIPTNRIEEESYILDRVSKGQRIEHFETLRRHKDGRLVDMSLTISPIRTKHGDIVGVSKIGRNITEQKESESRIRTLMREVNHRVKNQFAVILSMVRESKKRAVSPDRFETDIRERIMALSRSHDLLVEGDWRGATLTELVTAQLKPFGDAERINLSGAPIVLSSPAVQYLGIAFHELATNSAKYGALSVPGGMITVAWSATAGDEPRLRLVWSEHGGPQVAELAHGGFGRVMLERIAPSALSGVGHLGGGASGLVWTLDAPMAYVGSLAALAPIDASPFR